MATKSATTAGLTWQPPVGCGRLAPVELFGHEGVSELFEFTVRARGKGAAKAADGRHP